MLMRAGLTRIDHSDTCRYYGFIVGLGDGVGERLGDGVGSGHGTVGSLGDGHGVGDGFIVGDGLIVGDGFGSDGFGLAVGETVGVASGV